MEKKIFAFYDVLLLTIISMPFVIGTVLVSLFGELNDFDWLCEHVHLVLLWISGIAVPMSGSLCFRFVVINNNTVYFHYFPFFKTWKKIIKNIDINWNQNIIVSEIQNIEIVKLTKEEKQTKVFYRHWFNKYLKINLKYGDSKYVYVGNYSDFQIIKIIKILIQK